MAKINLHVPKYKQQQLFGYVIRNDNDLSDRLYMARANSKNVLVSKEYLRSIQRKENLIANDKYDFTYLSYYIQSWQNDYLKDAKWVVIKVKPPRHEGVYTFSILDEGDDTVRGLREIINSYNKKLNRNDSFYCLGIMGTRIEQSEWVNNASIEEPHHRAMRRIFKQPSIWRSYPNLYPKAKEKIPYFDRSGEKLDPHLALTEQGFPQVKEFGIPKDVSYTSVDLTYTGFRPTFDSPNVRFWGEHGYKYVA